jgi:Fic family protein
VEPLIGELVRHLNDQPKSPEIVRAAMAHLNLVMIHPFSDGNGRMARCLHTLVLAREGILEPDFCSIEETLGRWQQEYYDVLSEVGKGSWHPRNDAKPWLSFILKAHLSQAYRILWFNEYLDRIWQEATNIAAAKNLPDRSMFAIAEAIMGMKIKNATYRGYAGISEILQAET